jgi:hypothetical protein
MFVVCGEVSSQYGACDIGGGSFEL